MAGWQHPWFNVFFSRQTLKLQPGLSHRIEDEATLIDEVPRGSLSAKFDINCSWREIYLHRKRLGFEHDWDMWLDFKSDLMFNIYLYLFGYVNVKPTSLLNGWDLNCFRVWQSPGLIWRGKCVLLLILLLDDSLLQDLFLFLITNSHEHFYSEHGLHWWKIVYSVTTSVQKRNSIAGKNNLVPFNRQQSFLDSNDDIHLVI